MPKVCRYIPNRTVKRSFTEADVARIARYAIRDGANPQRLLAKVLVAIGLAGAFQALANGMSVLGAILDAVATISIGLAVGKLVELLANFAFYGKFIPIPAIRAAAVAAAALVVVLNKLLPSVDKLGEVSRSAEWAQAISDYINSSGGG